ncbi:pyridoxal phosphate-dependent decarboxylase family protein [Azospirillum sp.]|uniref:pyridoxal phosphate-dependent decarboxylase family protein n=1 Tax=Azospirillum sp. TaxID=34012 RepID=UPI003D746D68
MGLEPEHESAWRQAAEAAIAYRRGIDARVQRPEAVYREALEAFDAPLADAGQPPDAVVRDLIARSGPGLSGTTGPRFFGWVIGASHPVGVAADWLTAAWGQNAGNHVAAPAAAAAETVAARWLLDLLGLPAQASVGFVTGATMANVVGLAAARGEVLRRAGWDVEADGLFGAPPISVLIGEDAHATVFSALQFLGLGHNRVIRVPTTEQGAMDADAFEAALAACTGPSIVITQAGQINTGAFDPHDRIVPLARARGAWVHVDGAFGLWARACPARAHLGAGIEAADSWATDGHKWLQTPYDCGYAIVRDAEAHRRAMTIAASYLPPVAEGERDPSHYVPELSRRARGFATWAMIRHLGRQGVADMVERHCRLARRMAAALADDPRIAVLNDVVLNQVVVRFGDDDEFTLRVIRRVQEDGTCFAGGANWRGRWVMRLSVIGATTEADADLSVAAIRRTLDAA